MRARTGLAALGALALLAGGSPATAQVSPQPGPPSATRPYIPRIASKAMETDRFRSIAIKVAGDAALLYEPKTPLAGKGRVAIVYANNRFDFGPPAIELASRGYRVLHVSAPPSSPGAPPTPYDNFKQVSAGIAYMRALPGVRRVVVAGWGAGAATMTLYVALAQKGPAVCQNRQVIYPCVPEQASGLAKPDGMILFDAGPGSGSRPSQVDPDRPDLDVHSVANGYDPATDTAHFPATFRAQYFAAQSARNDAFIDAGLARLSALGGPTGRQDEMMAPNTPPTVDALSGADLTLQSHTKQPHLLLKADGTRDEEILRSVRPTASQIPGPPPPKPGQPPPPPRRFSLREYLANDAIRTTKDFAFTEDDIVGVDWASSNLGTPAQAESVTVPALLVTNTCFQFVVSAEIVLDHLASKDKEQVGVEGSQHEFTPCKPEYGDTKKRLFDYTADWLAKPGRF
ncbi:MAG TPA: hypothetical protein VMU59_09850 [Caulobacteraceae bacterium]|nr:hypothetical protein [Caulobacteraceae bacterium]